MKKVLIVLGSMIAGVLLLAFVGFKVARQQNAIPPLKTLLPATQETAQAQQTPVQQQALFEKFGLEKINLPAGFTLSVFAQVPNARSLAISPNGTVFVGNRAQKNVYAVVDENSDGFADRVYTIATGLNMPNGVAFKDGDLYVATVNQVLKFSDIENNLATPQKAEILYSDYPTDTHHGWKFIAFGPDGKLYIPVGAPCNNCLKDNPIYSSITRFDLSTKKVEIVAQGVRNSVGFDWHPASKELWFTDNGRDQMGDNVPTDELNVIKKMGEHFGFPFCHQGDVQDPDISPRKNCSEFSAPVKNLSPHAAALGMRFYTGEQFPTEYKNQIFIAEHGSWNRTEPIGYRVMLVKLDGEQKAVGYEPFADGWLQSNGDVIGRPVDVATWTDGSLLISDDDAGLIYRVSYTRQ